MDKSAIDESMHPHIMQPELPQDDSVQLGTPSEHGQLNGEMAPAALNTACDAGRPVPDRGQFDGREYQGHFVFSRFFFLQGWFS